MRFSNQIIMHFSLPDVSYTSNMTTLNYSKGTYCCFSMETMCKQTCNNVTLYIHCASC